MAVIMTGGDNRLGLSEFGLLFRVPTARLDLWVEVGDEGVWSVVQDENEDYWIQGEVQPPPLLGSFGNAILRLLPLYGPVLESYVQGEVQVQYDVTDLPDIRGITAYLLGNVQVDGRAYFSGMGYLLADDDQPSHQIGTLSAQPAPIFNVFTEIGTLWSGDTPLGFDYELGPSRQEGYINQFEPATVTMSLAFLDNLVGTIGLLARKVASVAPIREGWARFRNITITRQRTVSVVTLDAGQWVLLGTFDGRIRKTEVEVGGALTIDLSPFTQPADFIQVWNGNPDAGGTLQLEWVPVQGVYGGDKYEWAAAGWNPENNVSSALPTGTLEQVNFNLPIAGWGVTEIPGVGTNYSFSRSIKRVNELRDVSVAVAFLTIKDQASDPFDLVLYEGIASEGFFGGTALNFVRINGPEGLADVNFDIPLSIVNLIGAEDSKQYELKVIDSRGQLDLIERGVVRCTATGLSFTAIPTPA